MNSKKLDIVKKSFDYTIGGYQTDVEAYKLETLIIEIVQYYTTEIKRKLYFRNSIVFTQLYKAPYNLHLIISLVKIEDIHKISTKPEKLN